MNKQFYIFGDTHGNHQLIIYRIKSRKIKDTTIFHVGDFGVGFKILVSDDESELLSLNKFLRSKNCHMYVIRGNHDNPEFFKGGYEYSNLHLVPDYTVVEVNGENILMVGGAISVDRRQRKVNMLRMSTYGMVQETYWYDEGFVLDEDKLVGLENISYIITHSSPDFAYPINDQSNIKNSHGDFVEQFAAYDDSLKDDLNKERNGLTDLWKQIRVKNNIKAWFYGHFHTSNISEINGTVFRLLDVGELVEIEQEIIEEQPVGSLDDIIGELKEQGIIDDEFNYKLIRKHDGTTKKSKDIKWVDSITETFNDEIKIGCKLLMSPFTHTFTWLTTEVTEIIENTEDVIHFKTKNSEYKLFKGELEKFNSDEHRESIVEWRKPNREADI